MTKEETTKAKINAELNKALKIREAEMAEFTELKNKIDAKDGESIKRFEKERSRIFTKYWVKET